MSKTEIAARLTAVRRAMEAASVDVLLVRSTDRYLNEYVPTDESSRVFISGFTGSMGEVAITRDRAYLAVDGRYWLQAEKETDPALYEIIRAPLSTSIDDALAGALAQVADKKKKRLKIGFPPERMPLQTLAFWRNRLSERATFKAVPCLVEKTRGALSPRGRTVRAIDEAAVGKTVKEKIGELDRHLETLGVDALWMQRLDEIAYLTNLRGDEIPYQATFKATAVAIRGRLWVGLERDDLPKAVRDTRPDVEFVPAARLFKLFGRGTSRPKVAFDPAGTTEWARATMEKTGAELVSAESPVGPMKARKNKAELASMRRAFARADGVVDEAARWLCKEVVAGRRVTEASFAARVDELFAASGAVGLSFRIISAAGKNGAIIHYSDPSPRRVVKRGELMLLDTGAYYEEGYATDLTRTFLVDGPKARGTDEQRRYYTLVLKAALAGMSAVLPVGARGGQLDAITRAPLWAAGLNFNHGTGHGVGISVHEFPPRVGPNATSVLEEGFVFSIEPGVYLPGFGGIRIENLCTIEPAPKMPGFMRVVPLTFSPLDARLIDPHLLSRAEKDQIAQFSGRRRPVSA